MSSVDFDSLDSFLAIKNNPCMYYVRSVVSAYFKPGFNELPALSCIFGVKPSSRCNQYTFRNDSCSPVGLFVIETIAKC